MLPLDLVSESVLPKWARAIRLGSVVLPGGLVVNGKSGVYSLGERCFASSSGGVQEAIIKLVSP